MAINLPTSVVHHLYQGACHVAGSCVPLPDVQPSSLTSCSALASLCFDFWPEGYEWSGREKPATWSVLFFLIEIVCENNSPKAGCTNLLKPQSPVGNKASGNVTSTVK